MVSKLQKTKKTSDYTRLRENGNRLANSKFIIVNYIIIPDAVTKFGVTVSAKVGPAHIRNKLKRWCREYMRLHEKTESLQRHIEINFIFKIMHKDFYKKLEFSIFSKELDWVLERVRSNSTKNSSISRGTVSQ